MNHSITARSLRLGSVVAVLLALAPWVPTAAHADGTTVVSLTFNDGKATGYTAGAPVLKAHGMHATFYVASGWVTSQSNGSMGWWQLKDLSRDGNEIGGMGANHSSLTGLTAGTAAYDAAKKQVCDDFATLTTQGFDPRSFAYPTGATDATAEQIVAACNFTSGRVIGQLPTTLSGVTTYAETLPTPADVFRLRTAALATGPVTLAQLTQRVNDAVAHRGTGSNWIPLAFNDVCDSAASGYSTCMNGSKPIDKGVFDQFLSWLGGATVSDGTTTYPPPSGVSVQTMREALGLGAPPAVPPDKTTVSLTFNDGHDSQYTYARPLLQSHNMNATFYISSGPIDKSFSAWMEWWQIDDLYRDGNEIGSMDRDHADLTTLSTADATTEACSDYDRLNQRGYDPRTFAYPTGKTNSSVEAIVQGCHFAAARIAGGLSASQTPFAETLPPADAYAIRTANAPVSSDNFISLQTLQNAVTAAAHNGGGWLPIALNHVCHVGDSDYSTCSSSSKPILDTTLSDFLDWMSRPGQANGAPAGTDVKTVRAALGLPPQPVLPPRPTVVSITFDDGQRTQVRADQPLVDHGFRGTFFLNSHLIDTNDSDTITWAQATALRDHGQEIGGHTLDHVNLKDTTTTYDFKYHQTCDDRARLIAMGFNPVSFAYPFGAFDATAESIVRACGFQSGRTAGSLQSPSTRYAEDIPPADPYAIRLLNADQTNNDGPVTLDFLENAVTGTATHGGGWLPVLFHEICDPAASDYSSCMAGYRPVSLDVFTQFLDWLKNTPPVGVSVRTIGDVMSGGALPSVVSISSPASNGQTVSEMPTISGTAGTGSADAGTVTVRLYAGGYATGTPVQTLSASVQSDGTWSVQPTTALNDSSTYSAIATQQSGSNTGSSAPVNFVVDGTTPSVQITSPANGTTTNKAAFAGTAGTATGDASSVTVSVYQGTSATGSPAQALTGSVATDGTWQASTTGLADGTYTVVASQQDAVGHTGVSIPITFTMDSTAPVVTVSSPAAAATLATSVPAISGTAGMLSGDAGTVTVSIYAGTTTTVAPLQTLGATVASDGTWTATEDSLADGTYTVVAAQSDAAGNVGTSSARTFTVDTTAPAPSITAPASGGMVNSATPLVSGSAGTAAGDATTVQVDLYSGGVASGTPLQTLTASVGSSGAWSVRPSSLSDGTYTVVARQSDAAGNTGFSSDVTFIVDTVAPSVSITAPTSGAVIASSTASLSGTAGTDPTDGVLTVSIYSGTTASGSPLMSVTPTVTADGWSVVAQSLADGSYTAVATQTDLAGNKGTATAGFQIDTSSPSVTVGSPSSGAFIATGSPTITGTAGTATGDASTVTVNLYTGTDTSAAPLLTSSVPVVSGTWSLSVSATLGDGPYSVTATQTDAAGHSTTTPAVTFTVDTVNPAVTVTAPATGSTVSTRSVPAGGAIGTATGDTRAVTLALFAGTTATGTPVRAPSATVNVDNTWSATLDLTSLSDGSYTLRATQLDAAGNVGTAVTTFGLSTKITVKSVTPNQVGQGAVQMALTVTGSGFVPGTTVTFSGTGIAVASTPLASADGLSLTTSVSVTATAATGKRNVTVTTPTGLTATCSGCLTVNPAPKPTSATPSSLASGATSQKVTIKGSGFKPAATVVFSGTGVTGVVAGGVKSDTLPVTVSVTTDAATGPRDITVTNPDGGVGVCAACFTVVVGPTISSLTPSSVRTGKNTTVTITGTGFVSGATAQVSGTGVTAGKPTFVSSTTLTVPIGVKADAPTGARTLTVTNPGSAGWGTASATLTITN